MGTLIYHQMVRITVKTTWGFRLASEVAGCLGNGALNLWELTPSPSRWCQKWPGLEDAQLGVHCRTYCLLAGEGRKPSGFWGHSFLGCLRCKSRAKTRWFVLTNTQLFFKPIIKVWHDKMFKTKPISLCYKLLLSFFKYKKQNPKPKYYHHYSQTSQNLY